MKTTFSKKQIADFLEIKEKDLEPLIGGNVSQAFGYLSKDNQKLVIRVSSINELYLGDEYAFVNFGLKLPIPKVVEHGSFTKDTYYCITQRAEGKTITALDEDQFRDAFDNIHKTIAKIYTVDVSKTQGFGSINVNSGNGKCSSWKEAMQTRLESLKEKDLKNNAKNIGIDPSLIDYFISIIEKNIDYLIELRTLSHGDLGSDNILVKNREVTALIDWANLGYTDWLYDYMKLEFWWPNKYMDAVKFGKLYNLNLTNFEKRKAVYIARSALSVINWADEYKAWNIVKLVKVNLDQIVKSLA